MDDGTEGAAGPLAGIKVVIVGQLTSGPMAGTLLADLGAHVVHVEDPKDGDPARKKGLSKDGHNLWWKVSARNKRSVTLDLRVAAGRDLCLELIDWADVYITNVRVDTLGSWGLAWPQVHTRNPRLVMLHVSANGLNTSTRNDPGFGKVGEARSGVVHLTGFPDGPPVHAGFSHGDTTTSLMGAFAICAALVHRDRPDFTGELIDLALYEALYRLIDFQVINYDQLGVVAARAGNTLAAAPGVLINCYLTSDDAWVTVTSGTVKSVQNIAALVGEPADAYATRDDQRANNARLDGLVRDWMRKREADECVREMVSCGVVASRVFDVEQIMTSDLYRERGDVVSVDDRDLGPVRMPAVIPRLTEKPGAIWRTGPRLGEDNDLVYGQWLGKSAAVLAELGRDGVI
jgi:formyl-CoA transferase